jgi:hypothetical protein
MAEQGEADREEHSMTITYPTLVGKVVKEVTFGDDDHWTVLAIEFDDGTRASFRQEATISFYDPEIATVREGDLINHRKLQSRKVA